VPKEVDHEERRERIAEAVWRVILREGVAGVSIRKVAAEAGLSTGALVHYVATKEELLASADRLLVGRVVGRLEARPKSDTVRGAVRSALCEVLPLDAERRTESAVWFALAGRALVDKGAAGRHYSIFDGTRELCRRITRQLAAGGHLAPGLDPEGEAGRLQALVDGLAVEGLVGRLGNEEILGVLDGHLDEIMRET
jgi:AcrR family transcriptional regulator